MVLGLEKRLEFQAFLEEILGSEDVYFQPPENITLTYPCVIYKRDLIESEFADNVPYSSGTKYEVMVITSDPDDDIVPKVAGLPQARHLRFYTADKLNHDVFTVFY